MKFLKECNGKIDLTIEQQQQQLAPEEESQIVVDDDKYASQLQRIQDVLLLAGQSQSAVPPPSSYNSIEEVDDTKITTLLNSGDGGQFDIIETISRDLNFCLKEDYDTLSTIAMIDTESLLLPLEEVAPSVPMSCNYYTADNQIMDTKDCFENWHFFLLRKQQLKTASAHSITTKYRIGLCYLKFYTSRRALLRRNTRKIQNLRLMHSVRRWERALAATKTLCLMTCRSVITRKRQKIMAYILGWKNLVHQRKRLEILNQSAKAKFKHRLIRSAFMNFKVYVFVKVSQRATTSYFYQKWTEFTQNNRNKKEFEALVRTELDGLKCLQAIGRWTQHLCRVKGLAKAYQEVSTLVRRNKFQKWRRLARASVIGKSVLSFYEAHLLCSMVTEWKRRVYLNYVITTVQGLHADGITEFRLRCWKKFTAKKKHQQRVIAKMLRLKTRSFVETWYDFSQLHKTYRQQYEAALEFERSTLLKRVWTLGLTVFLSKMRLRSARYALADEFRLKNGLWRMKRGIANCKRLDTKKRVYRRHSLSRCFEALRIFAFKRRSKISKWIRAKDFCDKRLVSKYFYKLVIEGEKVQLAEATFCRILLRRSFNDFLLFSKIKKACSGRVKTLVSKRHCRLQRSVLAQWRGWKNQQLAINGFTLKKDLRLKALVFRKCIKWISTVQIGRCVYSRYCFRELQASFVLWHQRFYQNLGLRLRHQEYCAKRNVKIMRNAFHGFCTVIRHAVKERECFDTIRNCRLLREKKTLMLEWRVGVYRVTMVRNLRKVRHERVKKAVLKCWKLVYDDWKRLEALHTSFTQKYPYASTSLHRIYYTRWKSYYERCQARKQKDVVAKQHYKSVVQTFVLDQWKSKLFFKSVVRAWKDVASAEANKYNFRGRKIRLMHENLRRKYLIIAFHGLHSFLLEQRASNEVCYQLKSLVTKDIRRTFILKEVALHHYQRHHLKSSFLKFKGVLAAKYVVANKLCLSHTGKYYFDIWSQEALRKRMDKMYSRLAVLRRKRAKTAQQKGSYLDAFQRLYKSSSGSGCKKTTSSKAVVPLRKNVVVVAIAGNKKKKATTRVDKSHNLQSKRRHKAILPPPKQVRVKISENIEDFIRPIKDDDFFRKLYEHYATYVIATDHPMTVEGTMALRLFMCLRDFNLLHNKFFFKEAKEIIIKVMTNDGSSVADTFSLPLFKLALELFGRQLEKIGDGGLKGTETISNSTSCLSESDGKELRGYPVLLRLYTMRIFPIIKKRRGGTVASIESLPACMLSTKWVSIVTEYQKPLEQIFNCHNTCRKMHLEDFESLLHQNDLYPKLLTRKEVKGIFTCNSTDDDAITYPLFVECLGRVAILLYSITSGSTIFSQPDLEMEFRLLLLHFDPKGIVFKGNRKRLLSSPDLKSLDDATKEDRVEGVVRTQGQRRRRKRPPAKKAVADIISNALPTSSEEPSSQIRRHRTGFKMHRIDRAYYGKTGGQKMGKIMRLARARARSKLDEDSLTHTTPNHAPQVPRLKVESQEVSVSVEETSIHLENQFPVPSQLLKKVQRELKSVLLFKELPSPVIDDKPEESLIAETDNTTLPLTEDINVSPIEEVHEEATSIDDKDLCVVNELDDAAMDPELVFSTRVEELTKMALPVMPSYEEPEIADPFLDYWSSIVTKPSYGKTNLPVPPELEVFSDAEIGDAELSMLTDPDHFRSFRVSPKKCKI